MEKLFGIDISHWQGDMSIEQARNERGVRFAIIKAAGADDGKYKDSKFENYYAQCKAIGLPVGAYYYGNAKVCYGGRTGGRPFPVSYCREAV